MPITRDFAVWDEGDARAIIAGLCRLEGAALPILHGLQDHFGWVPPQAHAMIADALNISRAEMLGIVSFYHDFRTQSPPRRIVKLCRAEACQAQGCEELVAEFEREFGIAGNHQSADLAIETIYCLGNCALGPSAMVGDELVGRLDVRRLAELCGLVEGSA